MIVVPVYNEVAVVASTIRRIQAVAAEVPGWHFDVACVDDGSVDGSREVVDGLTGVKVLRHESRQGYGASLCHAIDDTDHPWIFIVDADGTYPLADLPRFCEAADVAEMVVGRRTGVGIRSSPFRRFARWTLRLLVLVLTGSYITDLNSGMRLFRRDLYARFRPLLPKGFSFTTTITVASLFHRVPIRFLDINYGLRVGTSTLRPVPDFVSFVVLIVRLATLFGPSRVYLSAGLMAVLSLVTLGLCFRAPAGSAFAGLLGLGCAVLFGASCATLIGAGWNARRTEYRQRREPGR